MLEQEIASVMHYTLIKAENPTPYYKEVPEGFLVPSVYFPIPEILSSGDTLTSFKLEYAMYIKFFHKDTALAHDMALAVFLSILRGRCLIPLIDENGKATGKNMRVKDPLLRKIGSTSGVVELEMKWDSRRPYNREQSVQMQDMHLNIYTKEAYAQSIKRQGGNNG